MDWAPYARQVLATLGQPATYRTGAEALAVTALVRRDVQLEPEGFQGQAATRRVSVELLAEEIGDVSAIRRGETIDIDGTCYVVERVEADDGVVVRVLAYQEPAA
jgi:hypothetical protein